MTLPTLVGVCGGGRMGAGIAHAFLVAGSRVCVVERGDAEALAAESRIRGGLLRAAERATLIESVEGVLARLTVSVQPAAFTGADLVIEAVPEDRTLKAELLT